MNLVKFIYFIIISFHILYGTAYSQDTDGTSTVSDSIRFNIGSINVTDDWNFDPLVEVDWEKDITGPLGERKTIPAWIEGLDVDLNLALNGSANLNLDSIAPILTAEIEFAGQVNGDIEIDIMTETKKRNHEFIRQRHHQTSIHLNTAIDDQLSLQVGCNDIETGTLLDLENNIFISDLTKDSLTPVIEEKVNNLITDQLAEKIKDKIKSSQLYTDLEFACQNYDQARPLTLDQN